MAEWEMTPAEAAWRAKMAEDRNTMLEVMQENAKTLDMTAAELGGVISITEGLHNQGVPIIDLARGAQENPFRPLVFVADGEPIFFPTGMPYLPGNYDFPDDDIVADGEIV